MVRWLAVLTLALLLWRLVTGRRGGGLVMTGERPDWRYAIGRLRGIVSPPVEITPPPPGIRFEHDVEVAVSDGTILRVNVFRPESEGRYPVIMCAHPYGKDRLPKRGPLGYRPPPQYRWLRQPKPVTWSAWTSWETPDPAYWVPRGYVVVNCDLRGFVTSEGRGNLLTEAEARDIYDLIEWAGTQPWSNGKVGMNGVSYLAISQYKVAACAQRTSRPSAPGRGLATFIGTSPAPAASARMGSYACGVPAPSEGGAPAKT